MDYIEKIAQKIWAIFYYTYLIISSSTGTDLGTSCFLIILSATSIPFDPIREGFEL